MERQQVLLWIRVDLGVITTMDWLIDFSDMPTRLGSFYTKMLGNHDHFTFMFTYFVPFFLKVFSTHLYTHTHTHIYIRGSLNKFPDFFRMGTFIDNTHMKPYSPSKESPLSAMHLSYRSNIFWKTPWKSSCVNYLRHNLFHLLNCLITTASELRE